ncbi:MAG: hypothetical protein NVSMB32_08530 [Actinomycetota bacterium]
MDAQERQEELITYSIITEKLGATPQTYVFLDLLKNRLSLRLAMRVIREFNKRWGPSVFCTFCPLELADSGQTSGPSRSWGPSREAMAACLARARVMGPGNRPGFLSQLQPMGFSPSTW